MFLFESVAFSPAGSETLSKSAMYGTVFEAARSPSVHGRKYTENIVALRFFDMRFPGNGHWAGHGTAGFSRRIISQVLRHASYFTGAADSNNSAAGGYTCT